MSDILIMLTFMEKIEQDKLMSLYFLGPKGEQRKLFQEMIELINNDMIFWRRNFHPKDPPTIAYSNFSSATGQYYQENLIQSLVQLLAELKMDLPFFSPRYLAHMTADVTLPALLGYYAGLLYNANNVSGEASPVTLKYELEVGRQFAELFEFDDGTSFGHIASGGTVANFESIFYHKAARFLPVTMALTLKENNLPWSPQLDTNLWSLMNIKLDELPALFSEFISHGVRHGIDLKKLCDKNSPASLGDRFYWRKVEEVFSTLVPDPVLIVPSTAHYSWSKSAHLFGIGKDNCLTVKLDQQLTMSVEYLREVLGKCLKEKRPIIQTVCVLGSTEFGSFDPLDKIFQELKLFNDKGLYTPVHVDGAYGGYFKTMFCQGKFSQQYVQKAFLECPRLGEIFQNTKHSDSITVDPHKLGHTPYGAGVFVTRHGFIKDFVAEEADYCLTSKGVERDESFPLGKYILEGSKPGASATSVYFANKMIPLNTDGYGPLLLELIQQTKIFYQKILTLDSLGDHFSKEFELRCITEPHSNLICFYVRPKKLKKLSSINLFNEKLIHHYFPRPTNHIQDFNYFISKTKLKASKLVHQVAEEIFKDFERDDDHLQLIRLVFLNRWSNQVNSEGVSYMDDFISNIKSTCQEIDYDC